MVTGIVIYIFFLMKWNIRKIYSLLFLPWNGHLKQCIVCSLHFLDSGMYVVVYDDAVLMIFLYLPIDNVQMDTFVNASMDWLMVLSLWQAWRNSSKDTKPSPFRSIFCKEKKKTYHY